MKENQLRLSWNNCKSSTWTISNLVSMLAHTT